MVSRRPLHHPRQIVDALEIRGGWYFDRDTFHTRDDDGFEFGLHKEHCGDLRVRRKKSGKYINGFAALAVYVEATIRKLT